METMIANIAIWATPVLVVLTMTCGMISAHLKELVEDKMKIHQLKILDCFANEIISGNKMFELRINDRDYQKGDYIVFTALSEESGKEVEHAINTRLYEITCVIGGWGLRDGYVALGIREVKHAAD